MKRILLTPETYRKPVLRFPNDSYSDGVAAEMTIMFLQKTERKYLYVSLVTRKGHKSGTLITSAELYTLFSLAAKQVYRRPLMDLVEVSEPDCTPYDNLHQLISYRYVCW